MKMLIKIQAIGNGSNNTRSPKFISFSVNNRLSYFEQLITMLKIIQVDINDVTNEINKFVDQNSGDYSNGNDSSSIWYFKIIIIFVHDRLGHFEQLTTALETIHVNVDNISNEIDKSIGQD